MTELINMEHIVQAEAFEFQDTILRSVEQHQVPYLVSIKGLEFVIFPETFNPNYAKASLLLLDNMDVKVGDDVLDPFTGCGANAIFAAIQGASSVLAIDKYTMPYLCAKYNVHRLDLQDSIEVEQADLFEGNHSGKKFSLIIANPPFKSMKPRSNAGAALRDENYGTLRNFFSQVGDHLQDDGRIRMVFSDVGDMKLMQQLADQNRFLFETVASTTYASHVRIRVYEMRKK